MSDDQPAPPTPVGPPPTLLPPAPGTGDDALAPPGRADALAQQLDEARRSLAQLHHETRARLAAQDAQWAVLSQRLHAIVERLRAVEIRQDTQRAVEARQDAQLDIAEAQEVQEAQEAQEVQEAQEAQEARERRRADRRVSDAPWTTRERRRAKRRAQEDRERFEEAVQAQYVLPLPPTPPDELAPRRATHDAPHPQPASLSHADPRDAPDAPAPHTHAQQRADGEVSRHTHAQQRADARRRHPSLLARLLGRHR